MIQMIFVFQLGTSISKSLFLSPFECETTSSVFRKKEKKKEEVVKKQKSLK